MHPRALTIVAVLFLISGGAALLGVATELFHYRVTLDFNILNLWIGWWLLAHEPRGRPWALVVVQLNIVLLPPVGLLIWFMATSIEVRVLGVLLGHTSPSLAFAFVGAVWVLQVWEYRVLNRADVRALFMEVPGELAAPS